MLRPALAVALALTLAHAPVALAQGRGLSNNPAEAAAGVYKLDKTHASLAVKVRHLGFSNYTFLMRGLDAEVAYDPANLTASKVTVTVDPKSVDTGLADFDNEIGEDARFFGGQPITFVSRSLQRTGANTGRMTGDLTLRGVTRPATLDVTFNGGGPHPYTGKPTMGFSAKGVIKRTDFKVAEFLPVGPLGDEVEIEIEAEFNKS